MAKKSSKAELSSSSKEQEVSGQPYLSLRLGHLKSFEEKALDQEGVFFVFPREGSGVCVAQKAEQDLAPGDVLVIKGMAEGKLFCQGTELVFWFFSLRLEHFLPLFDGKEISLFQKVTASFENPKIFSASSPLATECRRLIESVPPQFDLDHRSQLLRVAAIILSEEFKMTHSRRMTSTNIEPRVVEVFENLNADQILNLSVGELAVKFGCSRRHLTRLFHQFFGYSVAALKMEMRLLKASSLLRDSTAKIINVAEQCGFYHLGLFNNCFKKRFGQSPGEWRKQKAREENQLAIARGENTECPLVHKGLCPLAVESYTGPIPLSHTSDSGHIARQRIQRPVDNRR